MRTSLSLADLVGLTIVSTILFLVYPNLLWRAPVGASHVGRFVVSYLAVIPLAAGATWLRLRRIGWFELVGAVAIVWAVKMLLTVGLYHFMVQGTAAHLEPAHTENSISHRVEASYVALAGFEGTTLAGRVIDGEGNPVSGALVVLPDAERGKPFPASMPESRLVYGPDAVTPALGILPVGGRMQLSNRTAATVVVRATLAGRGAFNLAVLPGERVATAKQQHRGMMRIQAGTGDEIAPAWSYVVANPYFAWSDGEGAFSISHAPVETHALDVYAVAGGRLYGAQARGAVGTDLQLTVKELVSDRGEQ